MRLGATTAALSLAAFAAAGAAQEAAPPFSLEDVGFTSRCRPNAAFERLERALWGVGSGDVAVPRAIAGEVDRRLMLDRPADWNGLRLRGITLRSGIERGPTEYVLLFADPPARVREVWNARGWMLPEPGGRRAIDGVDGRSAIRLDADADGSLVSCLRD